MRVSQNSVPYRGLLITLLCGITALLSACGSPSSPATPVPGGKLKVVATTLQIRSIAEAVAGDRADVRSILSAGIDAHEFQPKPNDVQAITESNLVLKNGIGLDDWVDRLEGGVSEGRPLVTVTEGIALRAGVESEEEGQDPHVWLDVTNAMTMTRNIRDALIRVDPSGASLYNANAEAYLTKLTELDNYIKTRIASIPEERRKMITNHDAFGYFFERYGLQLVGSVIPSMSTDAQPSAGDIADLIQKIKAEKVDAIFLESSTNPQLATQIASDTGIKVINNLYSDSMGAPGTPQGTYEGMMRHNADIITDALK